MEDRLPPMPLGPRRSSRHPEGGPPAANPDSLGLSVGLPSPCRRSPRAGPDSLGVSLTSPTRRSPNRANDSPLQEANLASGSSAALDLPLIGESNVVGSPGLAPGAAAGRTGTAQSESSGSKRDLEDLLQKGFVHIETLFRELDGDRCGAIPYPQMKGQLENRGLIDANKLDDLWRSVIDKDHNNKVDIAEFIVVLYMWRSRGLGSYRKLFQYNTQAVQTVKDSMEALERFYRKYDSDSSGYLSQTEVETFFRERLPKVATRFVMSFFQTQTKLSFSQFLKLLYVSFGGLVDDVHLSFEKVTIAPEESQLWRELVDLFVTLEEDYQDLAGGRPVTLEDLLAPATHVLERHKSAVGQSCEICAQTAAYRCPFVGCRLFICQSCYNSGVESHRSGYSGPDKQAVVAFVRAKFQRVDIDMSGALDYFEYTCFCFLCCEKINYASLCKSSHNPATVKKGLMTVSQNFKNYDRERSHSLTWDEVEVFCRECFGSIPHPAKVIFDKLTGPAHEIKLMGFFTFLYQLVMPHGQHISASRVPKPETQTRIVTVLPDTQPRKALPNIPNVDMTRVHWGMQLGKGGQSMAYKVTYDGMTLVAKRPHPRTSTAALDTMVKAAQLQARFNHTHITRVVGVHECKPVCILMELCEGGDVTALWSHSSGVNPILPPLQWRLAVELAEALHVLHTADPPVMHRDIKGANVFLDKDRHVLLADFDLATEEPTATDACGTPGYMGPEVLNSLVYDHRCDIFAYGGFLYEVTHGCFPFSKETSFDGFHTKVKALIEQGIRPATSPAVPERMRQLMQSCWQANPAQRPSMSAILTHLQAMKADFQW